MRTVIQDFVHQHKVVYGDIEKVLREAEEQKRKQAAQKKCTTPRNEKSYRMLRDSLSTEKENLQFGTPKTDYRKLLRSTQRKASDSCKENSGVASLVKTGNGIQQHALNFRPQPTFPKDENDSGFRSERESSTAALFTCSQQTPKGKQETPKAGVSTYRSIREELNRNRAGKTGSDAKKENFRNVSSSHANMGGTLANYATARSDATGSLVKKSVREE